MIFRHCETQLTPKEVLLNLELALELKAPKLIASEVDALILSHLQERITQIAEMLDPDAE